MKTTRILTVLLVIGLLIIAGCTREVTESIVETDDDNCFECHGGDGLLLQAKGEWQNSVHASGTNIDYTNRGGSNCTKCHNHNGFLDFLATGEVEAPYDNVSAIHCFSCHAPHETGDLTLRTEAAVTMITGEVYDHGKSNLCAHCHQSRRSPAEITDDYVITSTHWGPHHGPQGDLLDGYVGYEHAGYDYQRGGHNGSTTFPDGCITCHMGDPRQHSGYGVGGHSFNIQDDDGNNISGVCAGCHDGVSEIDFLADFDYDEDGTIEGYQTELDGIAEDLHALLEVAGVIDADGHPIKTTVADGDIAGAAWNFLTYHEDRSRGIHNFAYIHGLLKSSLNYMQALPTPENPGTVAAH